MFEYLCSRKKEDKPAYLDRIDELERLQIVRLKGAIDQTVIPAIEKRIHDNRRDESDLTIDKNILLDFKNVVHVDSATIAFHIVRLKEYQEHHLKLAFLNVSSEFKGMIEMFHFKETFKIYDSEEQAVGELN